MAKNNYTPHFDNIRQELAAELRKAKHTIFAAVAWLTDQSILSVLENKAQNGVAVQLIISAHEFNDYTRYEQLSDLGGEVYVVGSKDISGNEFMHNKFCVIDYKTVITGSYNWTKNAASNEENIIVLHNSEVAREYADQCISLIQSGNIIDFKTANDIRVSIVAPTRAVEAGETITISWKVENADKVAIEGIGSDLELKGSHSVKISSNRIFKIQATDGVFQKIKTIQIRVFKHPQILQFKTTREAIIRGQTITINWKAIDAETVTIDNGIGEVELIGELNIAPSKDILYTVTAHGETSKAVAFLKVLVYPTPTIKTIKVPVPTEIMLESKIALMTTSLPSLLRVDGLSNQIIHRTPKIDLLSSNIRSRPTIQDIATATGKEVFALEVPKPEKIKLFSSTKSALLDAAERVFKHDWRAMQLISQIRKTYDIK